MTAHDLLLLVGTAKGAFLMRSDGSRQAFDVTGPHLPGTEVYSMALDRRDGRQRLLAGAISNHWGPGVAWSDDLGATWTEPAERSIAFPSDADTALRRVWAIEPAPADQPGVVYAGVEPAALFRSDDGGEHFDLVRGLWDHPHRPEWQPGGGGLCLHTVLLDETDPDRLVVAISAAGVYVSDDGGSTWQASNKGIHARFLPDPTPEFGQCVHKVSPDAEQPGRYFLQHHGGVYRSDDGAQTWTDISAGLPSDFGFPIVAHPRRGGTAYVLPLQADEFRWTVDGRCRVYRTTDAGDSWEALAEGLPQEDAWLTVLRDAFCADQLDPMGLWFGTRTGQVYGSDDEGQSWRLVAENLPPVLCVKAGVLG